MDTFGTVEPCISKNCDFLVGTLTDRIKHNKLPTNKDVLRFLLYKNKVEKFDFNTSYHLTFKKVLKFWSQTEIPIIHKGHAISKLKKLFEDWKLLQKLKSRKSVTEETKRDKFKEKLSLLFDISCEKNLHLLKDQKPMEFLFDQRNSRLMNIGKWKPKKGEDKNSKLDLTSSNTQESDLEIIVQDSLDVKDLEYLPKIRAEKIHILSSTILASLDRGKISDRAGMQVVASTADALGHDVNEIAISYSTIRRARMKSRVSEAEAIKNNFKFRGPLICHFDGKLLFDLTCEEKNERLPILVTGVGFEKLLGVPKLVNGSGRSCADAIYSTLKDWNLLDDVKGVSFDTTASNTGKYNGAVVLLEKLMGKTLLSVACRHHVYELVLEKVFTMTMGRSTAPTVPLFKKFKEEWDGIDTSKYRSFVSDPHLVPKLSKTVKNRLLKFSQSRISEKYPREDYLELLKLTVIFLGGTPSGGIKFRRPAGLHRARWMARLLYGFKLLMFGRTTEEDGCFLLTPEEEAGLTKLVTFALVGGYIEGWSTAMDPTSAPSNDLVFLKTLKNYIKIDKDLGTAALEKFLGHQWYLSEELVGLSFFDRNMPVREKKLMVEGLKRKSTEQIVKKRIELEVTEITRTLSPSKFVTSNTMGFFNKLGIPTSFLSVPPSTWIENQEYLDAEKIVKGLKVVNDTAERGVALAEEYCRKLTKNDDQYQFILQCVSKHRKRFPDSNKSTIINGLRHND